MEVQGAGRRPPTGRTHKAQTPAKPSSRSEGPHRTNLDTRRISGKAGYDLLMWHIHGSADERSSPTKIALPSASSSIGTITIGFHRRRLPSASASIGIVCHRDNYHRLLSPIGIVFHRHRVSSAPSKKSPSCLIGIGRKMLPSLLIVSLCFSWPHHTSEQWA